MNFLRFRSLYPYLSWASGWSPLLFGFNFTTNIGHNFPTYLLGLVMLCSGVPIYLWPENLATDFSLGYLNKSFFFFVGHFIRLQRKSPANSVIIVVINHQCKWQHHYSSSNYNNNITIFRRVNYVRPQFLKYCLYAGHLSYCSKRIRVYRSAPIEMIYHGGNIYVDIFFTVTVAVKETIK